MKTKILTLAAILTLSLFTISCLGSTNYQPLKVGNSWYYTTSLGTKTLVKVVRKEKAADLDCYVMEITPEILGKLIPEKAMEEYLCPQSDMLSRVKKYFMESNTEIAYEPPQPVIHYPLTPGKSWRWSGKQGKTTTELNSTVEKFETIETMGKSFKCAKVVTTSQKKNVGYANSRWYCKGVGMVKEIDAIVLPNGQKMEVSMELIDYRLK